MKTRKLIISAAALIVAAAVISIFIVRPSYRLVLSDAGTGERYGTFPVELGDMFSVEFIHSVNKSPVRDYYEIRGGGEIYVVQTDYYGFGAGVQTELNPGETLEYGPDGAMQIKNIDKLLPNLTYVVGTVSDHVLYINGEEISLRDLCGRSSKVCFTVEKVFFSLH